MGKLIKGHCNRLFLKVLGVAVDGARGAMDWTFFKVTYGENETLQILSQLSKTYMYKSFQNNIKSGTKEHFTQQFSEISLHCIFALKEKNFLVI